MATSPIRVLLVEDDEVDRMAFERFVSREQLPYEYQTANSVERARALLGEQTFDVVIADYRLGRDTCVTLFDDLRGTPLVIVTGTGDEATAVLAMKRGAYDYLIKDAQGSYLTVLPVTVDQAIARRRADAELAAYQTRLEELVRERTAALEAEMESRQRAEADRRGLQAQLYHAQKMEAVGTLAAGVAHDFNNVLTAVFGYAEMARRSVEKGAVPHREIDGILEAAEQAAGVARALLTFSRQTRPQMTAVDLGRFVANSTRMLQRMLPALIEMSIDIDTTGPHWVHADPVQLNQILINLVVNARDAMPDGGQLRIAVRPGEAESVELSVVDTGSGMSEDVLARVCDPFFTTKPREQGTGLGMAVVHGIVESHGGQLRIESELGRGTSVRVVLPGRDAPPEPPQSSQVTTGATPLTGTVLIADDNRQVRAVLATALESAGCRVLEAADGEQTLQVFAAHRDEIDLAIVDIDMPKLRGTECLARLRKARPDLRAIVVTGVYDAGWEPKDPRQVRYLRKPFQLAELTRLAGKLLQPGDAAEP